MKSNSPSIPFSRHLLYAAMLMALSSLVYAQDETTENDEFSLDDTPEVQTNPEALAALTQVRSWIEFGIGLVSDDSFRFGRYRGLENQGGYGVLNIDWFKRAAYDAEVPDYHRLQLHNFGLSTREGQFEMGRQGQYRVNLDYSQMPMTRTESTRTVFNGVGSSQLTLPANWVGAQTTAAMTRLLPSLGPLDIQHDRKRLGLGFGYVLPRGWDFSSSVRHEQKEGIKTIGAVIGNSGGNPRAVILPEPIDYETREADLALRYADDHRQLEFKYSAAFFDDGNSTLRWDNPYTAINGWNAAAGFPTGDGQMALPPDNQFHQFSVSGGYTWANELRASADVAFGRMTQDEAFLPYTINPTLAASIIQPLPRASLDGQIDTTVANFRLGGRPWQNFFWNAALNYDDRDNQTPRDEYVYIGGDSTTQNVAANSANRRFNEPYSYQATKFKLDGGYRIARRTNLTASVQQSDTERTYSERESADETSYSVNLRHAASDWFSGSLRWVRADRNGSTYHGDEPFQSGYAPGYTSTVAGGWENPPGLRKFFLADRTRDRIGANVSITPSEQWAFNLDASRMEDDYTESELGVTHAKNQVYTLDVSYTPNARLSSYAFFTQEDMDLAQNGASIRGATRLTDPTDPTRLWTATHDDAVQSKGAGLKWSAVENTLDLGADYTYSKSRNQISMRTGSGLTSAPLPINHTRLSSFSVYAKYRVNTDWSMNLRWWKEHFRSSDFALDGIEENQLANVILLGEETPDYEVNVLTFALTYQF